MRIPKAYRAARWSDFSDIPDKVAKAKQTIKANKSLLLYGTCGSRKTWLSTCLMQYWAALNPETLQGNNRPRFIAVPQLCSEIRASYSLQSDNINARTEEAFIQECVNPDFVILDDIGVGRITPMVCEVLYNILERRKNDLKPTIITTNFSLDELSEKMDDRIASRCMRMGDVIYLGGKDWGMEQQKKKPKGE